MTVFNSVWVSAYVTVFENKPNQGTVKSLKGGFDTEILS